MANTSVDDMLWGCNNDTIMRVQANFSASEKREFAKAWRDAKSCARKNLNASLKKGLTMEHLLSICVYTGPHVHRQFNAALRTQRDTYGSRFKFHYLYVLLTSAIQTIKLRQPCYTSCRRSRDNFIGTVGQKMRFGSFTSTSLRTDLRDFGNKTCFVMRTCFGAYLSKFSVYSSEEEVLIPPYEQFEIMSKKSKGDKGRAAGLEDCEVVFVLKSVGWKSELNCKLVGP